MLCGFPSFQGLLLKVMCFVFNSYYALCVPSCGEIRGQLNGRGPVCSYEGTVALISGLPPSSHDLYSIHALWVHSREGTIPLPRGVCFRTRTGPLLDPLPLLSQRIHQRGDVRFSKSEISKMCYKSLISCLFSQS